MPKFTLTSNTIEGMSEQDYARFVERESMKIRFGPQDPTPTNLMRFRLKKRLKKQTVAAMMDVTARTYYSYENGSRPIPSDALVRLATLTGADLHEILMGRPATTNAAVIEAGLIDMKIVEKLLEEKHSEIDEFTRIRVARRVVTTDWGDRDRMHPTSIRRAISMVTKYRDDQLNLPAPPFFEDYKDEPENYERAMLEWQTLVDDNFGEEQEETRDPKIVEEQQSKATST